MKHMSRVDLGISMAILFGICAFFAIVHNFLSKRSSKAVYIFEIAFTLILVALGGISLVFYNEIIICRYVVNIMAMIGIALLLWMYGSWYERHKHEFSDVPVVEIALNLAVLMCVYAVVRVFFYK